MAAAQTDAQVAELCRQAFEAEHYSRFQDAFTLHGKAVVALNKLADDAKFLDRERKRIARKQVKFHTSRQEVLRPILSGQKKGLDVVLPSSISARESLATPINGLPCLSLDELVLSKKLQPSVPQGTVMNTKDLIKQFVVSINKDPSLITPEIQHLFPLNADNTRSVPFYTPTLNKSTPDLQFHVYISTENVFTSGRWYYFKVKDQNNRQVLYVMQGLKRPHYQVTQTHLSRSTEFTSPCVATYVTPVQSTGSSADGAVGRQLTHMTSSPLPVVDKPDRTKHVKWEPRRLTWGGRNFVWKKGAGMLDSELCEVKREWPQPGSKTGKMQHELFEPIVKVQTKFALKKTSVMTFKYGCGEDFLWRELVMASALTEAFVLGFGHND